MPVRTPIEIIFAALPATKSWTLSPIINTFSGLKLKRLQNSLCIPESGLAQYDMKVERDRNLKDKTIIGFFIYIEYFDRIVRKALSGQNPSNDGDSNDEL